VFRDARTTNIYASNDSARWHWLSDFAAASAESSTERIRNGGLDAAPSSPKVRGQLKNLRDNQSRE
jgi:hypothetical protein